MELTEILKALSSEEGKLRVLNLAKYVKEVTFSKAEEDCQIIFLGQKFQTYQGKGLELYYDVTSGTIFYQTILVSNEQKFLGKLCDFNRAKSYITEYYKIFISGVSNNNLRFKTKYLVSDFDEIYNKYSIHKVKCKSSLEDDNVLELNYFEIFDIEFEENVLVKYPLNFNSLYVYKNSITRLYDIVSDFENENNLHDEDYRIQQSIKNGEDEMSSWDEEGFWKAGRDGAD
ncbi:hypothetical protein ACQ33O_00520 [Ferruginibacter sp. SUN002]|uniref:hypothetical protein n=1 Tax=Ferruginibacter sp. SUN002 TaxID=2937789 RepID=UPI003D364215